MSTKKFIIFIIILFLLLPSSLILAWPSQKTQFIACNVGQGDAILVSNGFTQILIDGGPSSKVLDCLKKHLPFYDRTIELMINTHPEKDHLAGLVAVLKRYQVKQVVTDGAELKTNLYQEFSTLINKSAIPLFMAKKGDLIKIADLELSILWPDEESGQVLGTKTLKEGATNDLSLVIELTKGDVKAILAGDISHKVEEELVKNNQFNKIKILKVSHHGSKNSTSEEFLEAIKPKVAIISVGKNSYGHPTQEVLDRLNKIGSQILRTDQEEIKLSF